jgi:hypothetical protein
MIPVQSAIPMERAAGQRPSTGRAWTTSDAALTRPMPFPDPAWEEVLFDRLLDRWEERLREQTIRHLGFTGGQI